MRPRPERPLFLPTSVLLEPRSPAPQPKADPYSFWVPEGPFYPLLYTGTILSFPSASPAPIIPGPDCAPPSSALLLPLGSEGNPISLCPGPRVHSGSAFVVRALPSRTRTDPHLGHWRPHPCSVPIRALPQQDRCPAGRWEVEWPELRRPRFPSRAAPLVRARSGSGPGSGGATRALRRLRQSHCGRGVPAARPGSCPLRPERAGDGVVSDPGLGSWPRSQSPESVHREGPSAQVLVGGLRFGWGPRTNHWARRTSKAAVSMKDPGNPPLPTGWPLFRIRLRSSPPPAWVVSRVGISVCPCPPGVPTQGGNGSLWKSAPEVLGRPQGPGGLVVFAEGVLG